MSRKSTWGQPLGLDELMIVNPSPSQTTPNVGGLFLGEDGTLYQVQISGQPQLDLELGQLFLGEDGTVYRLEGLS